LQSLFFLSLLLQPRTPKNAPAVASGDQRFHFTEKPGSDAVGLKVVEQYDFSRTYRDVSGNVWIANGSGNSVSEILGGASPAAPLSNAVASSSPGTKP
jgi:hypothetical protein